MQFGIGDSITVAVSVPLSSCNKWKQSHLHTYFIRETFMRIIYKLDMYD